MTAYHPLLLAIFHHNASETYVMVKIIATRVVAYTGTIANVYCGHSLEDLERAEYLAEDELAIIL